jgi:NDP-sugar pyrophosphorylase family protein
MPNTQQDKNAQPLSAPPLGNKGIISHAMILAAGLGTRLKPWTDAHPKALALVNGKSLLQHNIEYLQRHGIYNVIVNVYHFAGQIITSIEQNHGWGSNVTISNETDAVLETGGGLKKARWYFDDAENFVLMNVDVLTDMNLNAMMAAHIQRAPLATLATTNRPTSRYFLFNDSNVLCGWRNVKTGEEKMVRTGTTLTQQAFSGVHVINQKLLSLIQQEGKFSMVDVYLSVAADNIIQSFDHSSSRFIDVGKPESMEEAGKMFVM